MVATMREHDGGAEVVVTPGELLGPSSILGYCHAPRLKVAALRWSPATAVFSTPALREAHGGGGRAQGAEPCYNEGASSFPSLSGCGAYPSNVMVELGTGYYCYP
ncbi:hypothetical protein ZWY2020_006901 [Hordeum vulgare]|nr:hypothetical protein ZWY2020_006901 [Hordeum vulgare]